MKKNCKHCGNPFRCKPSHYDKRTYCSRGCMAEGYKTRLLGEENPNYSGAGVRNCVFCGVEFKDYGKKRYCSLECYYSSPEHKINAVAANDGTRKIPGNCKVCFVEIPRKRKMCDDCAPKPKPPGRCLHCGGYSGSTRNVNFCKPCRETGVHRTIPESICSMCGTVVYKYNRKYCDSCWIQEMSKKRGTPRKRDANQAEIVSELIKVGCAVIDFADIGGGFPDICVLSKGTIYLLEIKNANSSKRELTKLQKKFFDEWRGQVKKVETVEQALAAVGLTNDN